MECYVVFGIEVNSHGFLLKIGQNHEKAYSLENTLQVDFFGGFQTMASQACKVGLLQSPWLKTIQCYNIEWGLDVFLL
jgi:hypothetical protein